MSHPIVLSAFLYLTFAAPVIPHHGSVLMNVLTPLSTAGKSMCVVCRVTGLVFIMCNEYVSISDIDSD